MRGNLQRGASTVELLIAMAVAGAVMGAMVGVVYVANGAVEKWQQPLTAAAARPMVEILASALEGDAETLVPCRVSASEIDFDDSRCQPPNIVTYTLSGNDIVRSTSGVNAHLTHRLAARPAFAWSCSVQDSVDVGVISIANLNYGGPLPNLSIGFSSPRGVC